VVAKLDGDLRLTTATFEEILRRFDAEPRWHRRAYLAERTAAGVLERHRCPGDHVEGATKFYGALLGGTSRRCRRSSAGTRSTRSARACRMGDGEPSRPDRDPSTCAG
jgi:hypothetical protein